MTLRQAFYISIAAHIMVFGSAFAVAQYGRGLFLSSGDTVMVALVSPGPTPGDGRGSHALHPAPATDQTNAAKNEMTADAHAEPGTASMPAAGQMTGNADSGIAGPGLSPSASGAGQGRSAQSGGILSPEDLANLAAAIERTKNYPRLARERGIEGVVRVRFRMTPSGAVEKIEIVQSSGSEILDSASIGAVYRAAPLPHVSG
ncbi:MAG TPA: energy transducer TonB, partial [Nitrospirota bacterium]|nr:energy transducer TonB [Nitrospirota bacterium]